MNLKELYEMEKQLETRLNEVRRQIFELDIDTKTAIKKLKDMVDIVETDDCIIFPRLAVSGYGRITVNSKDKINYYRAHIISYKAFNGIIPEGALVRHTCGNRACVNPQHLETGNCEQNTIDSIKAGTHNNKFDDREVFYIREGHAEGETIKYLAECYDCDSTTISNIVNRRTYKHVA